MNSAPPTGKIPQHSSQHNQLPRRKVDYEISGETLNAPKTFRQRWPKPGGGWNWLTKGVAALPCRLLDLLNKPRSFVVVVEQKMIHQATPEFAREQSARRLDEKRLQSLKNRASSKGDLQARVEAQQLAAMIVIARDCRGLRQKSLPDVIRGISGEIHYLLKTKR